MPNRRIFVSHHWVQVTATDFRLGIRTAKYILSDIDATITGYENKLRELKSAFLEGVAVQTEITVVRMMNIVTDIGKCDVLGLQSDVHGLGIQRNPST